MTETIVGNKEVDIHTAQQNADGISIRKEEVDVRVINDITIGNETDVEEPDRSAVKDFEGHNNLYAANTNVFSN